VGLSATRSYTFANTSAAPLLAATAGNYTSQQDVTRTASLQATASLNF